MIQRTRTMILAAAAILAVALVVFVAIQPAAEVVEPTIEFPPEEEIVVEEEEAVEVSPLAIESLRARRYETEPFVVEETLPNGTNYRQMVVSYRSEGLKIYGLLTIPFAPMPEKGFPAVLFVHGYIPPAQYSTTGHYPTYQAALARGGFVTFKPDLRGHGRSEGEPVSAHYSEKYVVDALFALESLKQHEAVNPQRIGYWGHSNGGEIGLRVTVLRPELKAASFWAGVVGSYEDHFETYLEDIPFLREEENPLVRAHGFPSENPAFWDTIDPYAHLEEIAMPIELQHGTADASVPIVLSRHLRDALEAAGKTVEYMEYPGDDHNIGQNASAAWRRTIAFFEKYL